MEVVSWLQDQGYTKAHSKVFQGIRTGQFEVWAELKFKPIFKELISQKWTPLMISQLVNDFHHPKPSVEPSPSLSTLDLPAVESDVAPSINATSGLKREVRSPNSFDFEARRLIIKYLQGYSPQWVSTTKVYQAVTPYVSHLHLANYPLSKRISVTRQHMFGGEPDGAYPRLEQRHIVKNGRQTRSLELRYVLE